MSVIDCVLFAGELDHLELRMNVLSDVVDQFVICEASETFSGKPKPFHLWQHRDRCSFRAFGERLFYLPVELSDGGAWDREFEQRNMICDALAMIEAQPSDLILVSDVDEIPNPFAVALIAELEHEQPSARVYAFKQALYSFTVNWRFDRDWYGTRAVRYEHLGQPQRLRSTLAPQPGELVIDDGGVSYTWMGGLDAVRAKAKAFSHTEVDKPEYLTDANIRRAITEGRSLVDGDGNSYHWEDFGEQHPAYLRENRERFRGWFHEDWVAE